MNYSGVWRAAGFLSVGMVVGIAGTMVNALRSGPIAAPEPPREIVSPPASATQALVALENSDLRRRLETLERASTPVRDDAGTLSVPDRHAEVAPAVSEQQNADYHARALANHDREAKDPKWSEASETSVHGILDKIADTLHFRVDRVDCRMTTCTAELGWTDYSSAQKSIDQLITDRTGFNCGTEIFMPRPDDPSRPYSATLVYDCEETLAGR